MGKGNRSRQDRAFETVQNTVEATPKNTKLITTITTIAVSLLLVGCILLSVVVNTGIVLRTQTAAKTDNYSVSGTVMSYLIYSQAQQMVALYQQYGIDYSISDVLNSSFDSMAESTLTQVKQMLVLCEYAKANGIELSAEDQEAIDSYMASIDEAAASNFYSTASYIKLMYGNGVNASDIRKSLELNYLSNAAYEVLEKELEAKILKSTFPLDDYLDQFAQLKGMGSMDQLASMLPGVKPSQLKDAKIDEKLIAHQEAIIKAMTKAERAKPEILGASRKKRIAAGSGTSVEEVNKLLKQFEQIKALMKSFSNPAKLSRLAKGRMKLPF